MIFFFPCMAWVDKQPLEMELKFLCLIWQLVYIPCDKKWGAGKCGTGTQLWVGWARKMGWLETGKAVFPYSLQFGAVFTPGTIKGSGDSGMINKQICNTSCKHLWCWDLLNDKRRKAAAKRRHWAGQRNPVQKGLCEPPKPDQSTECLWVIITWGCLLFGWACRFVLSREKNYWT